MELLSNTTGVRGVLRFLRFCPTGMAYILPWKTFAMETQWDSM